MKTTVHTSKAAERARIIADTTTYPAKRLAKLAPAPRLPHMGYADQFSVRNSARKSNKVDITKFRADVRALLLSWGAPFHVFAELDSWSDSLLRQHRKAATADEVAGVLMETRAPD